MESYIWLHLCRSLHSWCCVLAHPNPFRILDKESLCWSRAHRYLGIILYGGSTTCVCMGSSICGTCTRVRGLPDTRGVWMLMCIADASAGQYVFYARVQANTADTRCRRCMHIFSACDTRRRRYARVRAKRVEYMEWERSVMWQMATVYWVGNQMSPHPRLACMGVSKPTWPESGQRCQLTWHIGHRAIDSAIYARAWVAESTKPIVQVCAYCVLQHTCQLFHVKGRMEIASEGSSRWDCATSKCSCGSRK